MNFHVLTLFPDMIRDQVSNSITGRAIEKGILNVSAVDIRSYTKEKHGHVDDYPYGGGAGMVMQVEPVYLACKDVCSKIIGKDISDEEYDKTKLPRVIYMNPQGRRFDQSIAQELSEEDDIILLCGHYEGIDERALEMVVTDNISIGDYILTGGELPALVMIDAISRLIPGVLNNDLSADIETFYNDLLEYPQYTRPEEYMGRRVPKVLLSGHHKNIEKWRLEQSIERTKENRPDLYEKYMKNKENQ